MDEMQLLFAEFADALRSLATVPREVAAELRRWGDTVRSAGAAMASWPEEVGTRLRAAAATAGTAISTAFAPVAEALSATVATALAPLTMLADGWRAVQTAIPVMAADLRALGNAIAPVISLFSGVLSAGFGALAPVLGTLQSTFVSLGAGISSLAATIMTAATGALATSFTTLTGMFRQLASSLGFAGSGLVGLGAGVGSLTATITTAATGALATSFTTLTGMFRQLASSLGLAGAGLVGLAANPLGGLARGFTGAGAPTAAAAGGMASAIGGMAGGVMGPFQQLAGAVGPFVQALNPSLMRLFNQALRDLMATFGTAFAPIIQHLSAVFNELSATLAPAMRALVPIIDNLMSALEGVFVPVIGMIADAFVALAPVIEFVTSIMASVAEAMRVVYTVFRSAIQVFQEVLKNVFGGIDLKGAAEGIKGVLQTLTKYFVQFAAYVAKALGYLDPFAKALEKNLRDLEGKKPGVKAAPENVHITGLEQISKDLAVAAFAAQAAGGQRKKSEAEFLEQLIKEVKDVQKNGKTLEEFLKEMQKKIVDGVMDDLLRLWDKFEKWLQGPSARELARREDRQRRREEGTAQAPKVNPSFWDNLWSQP